MVKNGALRLFRIAGIDVYIHWTWLVVVYVLYNIQGKTYSNNSWLMLDIALYIAMVTLHEAFQLSAGRLAKGVVSEMYISFLGRSSDLQLPVRPWPIIMTYSAGILGYVIMLGINIAFFINVRRGGYSNDLYQLSLMLLIFNVMLLAWTAVPVYPLDGGRVLHGLLWLVMGRKRALQAACIIGIPLAIGLVVLSIFLNSIIWVVSAVLIFIQCIQGFRQAKLIDFVDKLPRRTDVVCPHCKQHPFTFTSLRCPCGKELDPFKTRGICHDCGSTTSLIACPLCTQRSPIGTWFGTTGGFEVQNPHPTVTPQSAVVISTSVAPVLRAPPSTETTPTKPADLV